MDDKYCPKCKKTKAISDFYRNRSARDGVSSYCKKCHNAVTNEWRKSNPEKTNAIHTRWRHKRKLQILERYGRVCRCCGEDNPVFLCIDHINNDGAEHRREIAKDNRSGSASFYWWLTKNNFPPGFQVLCYNCNIGRYHNEGICPHQEAWDLEVMLNLTSPVTAQA